MLSRNPLFLTGIIILAVGGMTALIAGIGEIGYIQCIANAGTACTSSSSTQYVTVFLASSELLSVGFNLALIGSVLLIGGGITAYLAKLTQEMKTIMTPMRVCPKCGTQVAVTAKFCPSCGNNLSP